MRQPRRDPGHELRPRRNPAARESRAEAALEDPGDQERDGVPRQYTDLGLLTALAGSIRSVDAFGLAAKGHRMRRTEMHDRRSG